MTTTTTTTTIQTSKTKSGKAVQVAVIPAAPVDSEGSERMHWRATDIAQQQHGCTHYRVIADTGQLVASGKSGALPTQEQIARTATGQTGRVAEFTHPRRGVKVSR